jgi:cell division protein FtsI/penicillin-binding protein 2
VKSVVKISQTLSSLGFDIQLLGSQHYVKLKLDTLDTQQMLSLRKVFVKNAHPRLKKEVASSRHQPYGKTADYVKYIEAADSEKLAKLIKTLGLMLQTKVYLFWKNGEERLISL